MYTIFKMSIMVIVLYVILMTKRINQNEMVYFSFYKRIRDDRKKQEYFIILYILSYIQTSDVKRTVIDVFSRYS